MPKTQYRLVGVVTREILVNLSKKGDFLDAFDEAAPNTFNDAGIYYAVVDENNEVLESCDEWDDAIIMFKEYKEDNQNAKLVL